MRASITAFFLAASVVHAVPAGAAPARDGVCLSSGDTVEAVSDRKVIPPGRAIQLARRAVPNASVLRAALCRSPENLIYRITVLRDDGRVVQVVVDAPSGKVKGVR